MVCDACNGTLHGEKCLLCELFAEYLPPGGQLPTTWPMTSEAAAVSADQVPAAMERDKKAGVPTQYDKTGRPVFTDRGHRKAYLRSHGYRDNSGGYGD